VSLISCLILQQYDNVLKNDDQKAVGEMYKMFNQKSKLIVKDGLLIDNNEVKMKEYFNLLIIKGKKIGNDYSINYLTQITNLTAKIFGY